MVNLFRIAVYISVFTLYAVSAVAQPVSVTVWRDSVEASIGTTFINRLTLTNTSTVEQPVILSAKIPALVQLLSTVPEQLTLAPGAVVMIPVKGLVNQHTSSLSNQLSFLVSDMTGHVLQSVSFEVVVKGKSQAAVTLYTPEETIVLFTNSETVRLPLRLVHTRSRPERFSIDIASLPEGVDRSHPPRPIDLAPHQDTTISMLVNSSSRHWSTAEPYQLIVTVRDAQQSIVGTVVYKLVVAVANKRYTETNASVREGYGVSAALTRFSSNQWARETRVWGSDSVGKGQLDFQLHYLNYGTSHFQQLQNSFVSYRTERATVRLGSTYDFHELPLFGRGLKVNIGQPDRQWTLWAINSTANWLSSDENAWAGNVFSVRYDRQLPTLPGGSWSVSSNYFTQPATMRAGYLNFASFRYDQSERHSLQLLGGQSVEFARAGPNRAQALGWTGQLNYTYQSPTLGWQLRSYMSSPAYSGLQRGVKMVYSQLFWQPYATTTVLARLNYLQYNRTLFTSAVESRQQHFGNIVAEVSLSHTIGPVTVGVRPYWFSQRDQSNRFSQRADAYRVAPTLSFRRGGYQHVEISYDMGIVHNRTVVSPQPGFLSHRIVSSVGIGTFSLWGYIQKGPYYLFDLSNDRPSQIMTTSLTPTVDFALLNHRLVGSVGLNYVHDAASDESRYTAVGRVQYDITPNLTMHLSGNGTPYSQRPEYAYSQYRLEVIKRFNQLNVKHRGQLQLSFFEDANGNGTKDAGERWQDSLLVTVNENTLLTNAKGRITYQNMPPGTYAVSAISVGRLGDPVLYHENVTIGRSVTRLIPLLRTFRVMGQLQCKTNTYDRQPCQFNRYSIDIQRNQQTISSTSPLPDGTFSVHLAPGTYTLLVHDYSRLQQTMVKTTSFTLTETGQHPAFVWAVDASARPVEVKRFKAK